MRVAMLTGPEGPARPADWGAAAALCADTVSVAVVSARTLPPHEELRGVGHDPRQPQRYEIAAGRGSTRRIIAALRHEGARRGPLDVLHVHRPGTDRYAPRVAQELGVPYVLSEHDPRWYGQVGGRELRRAARLFRDAAAVLPVSDSLLLRFGELALPGHHRMLPVPLDEEALPAVPARARITQDAVRIVAAAPLLAGYGWEELADAFAAARDKDARLRLRIIGDGPRSAALTARVDDVDIAPDTGRAATLHALAHADLCAYPRPVSAFGETALDALACGTQVVGTRTGALPELVAHDGGLLTGPGGGPPTLTEALLEAAAHLPHHSAPTLATRIRRTYGLPAAADRLTAVYAEASGRA